ncbi:hypothetical protein AB1Y20_015915 [Prymnesium parvum]|uniref:Uncharacterized protein n=1 Tax=Prymnesium parvum TaxID=97485 RepID=A0AB34JZV3_PRYPA
MTRPSSRLRSTRRKLLRELRRLAALPRDTRACAPPACPAGETAHAHASRPAAQPAGTQPRLDARATSSFADKVMIRCSSSAPPPPSFASTTASSLSADSTPGGEGSCGGSGWSSHVPRPLALDLSADSLSPSSLVGSEGDQAAPRRSPAKWCTSHAARVVAHTLSRPAVALRNSSPLFERTSRSSSPEASGKPRWWSPSCRADDGQPREKRGRVQFLRRSSLWSDRRSSKEEKERSPSPSRKLLGRRLRKGIGMVITTIDKQGTATADLLERRQLLANLQNKSEAGYNDMSMPASKILAFREWTLRGEEPSPARSASSLSSSSPTAEAAASPPPPGRRCSCADRIPEASEERSFDAEEPQLSRLSPAPSEGTAKAAAPSASAETSACARLSVRGSVAAESRAPSGISPGRSISASSRLQSRGSMQLEHPSVGLFIRFRSPAASVASKRIKSASSSLPSGALRIADEEPRLRMSLSLRRDAGAVKGEYIDVCKEIAAAIPICCQPVRASCTCKALRRLSFQLDGTPWKSAYGEPTPLFLYTMHLLGLVKRPPDGASHSEATRATNASELRAMRERTSEKILNWEKSFSARYHREATDDDWQHSAICSRLQAALAAIEVHEQTNWYYSRMRIGMAIIWTCCNLWSMAEWPTRAKSFYLIKMTHWSAVTLTLYLNFGALTTYLAIYSNRPNGTHEMTPWFVRVTWMLQSVAFTSAVAVTVGKWLTDDETLGGVWVNGGIVFVTHGFNSVLAFVDYIMCVRLPQYLVHVLLPICYEASFQLFSYAYFIAGGLGDDGVARYIYNVMDYSSRPLKDIVRIFIATDVVTVPVVYVIVYLCYLVSRTWRVVLEIRQDQERREQLQNARRSSVRVKQLGQAETLGSYDDSKLKRLSTGGPASQACTGDPIIDVSMPSDRSSQAFHNTRSQQATIGSVMELV